MSSVRLFAAFDVPLEHRRAIETAIDPLKRELEAARWTAIENQHVTLKFFGWCDEAKLADVTEACRSVSLEHEPAALELAGYGGFPTTSKARVLWAGIDDPTGLSTALAAAIDRASEPLGFEPERRSFTPHLTLARFKMPARLGASLARLEAPTLAPFELNNFALFRSHLSQQGARYEELERFPLGQVDDAL